MKQAMKMMLPVMVNGRGNTPPIVREPVRVPSRVLST